jgi:hypothetical protein
MRLVYRIVEGESPLGVPVNSHFGHACVQRGERRFRAGARSPRCNRAQLRCRCVVVRALSPPHICATAVG